MAIKHIEIDAETGVVRVVCSHESSVPQVGMVEHMYEAHYSTKAPVAEMHGGKIKLLHAFPKGAKVKLKTDAGEIIYTVIEDVEAASHVSAQVAGTILEWDQAPDADVIEETPEMNEAYINIRGGITVNSVSLEDHTHDPLPSDVQQILNDIKP